MKHRTAIFVILVLLAARASAQTYSLSVTPSTLTFNVNTSPSDPQSYTLRNTGNAFMYVMISPSVHTQISLNGGSTWLSVNNNAITLNPNSTIVVYVRVLTSDPVAVLDEQVGNSRFTYATPTAPVQISGAAPLPITLASFSATLFSSDSVKLKWKTISEIQNYGFVVQGFVGGQWTDISPLIPGHGTTIEMHEYTYITQVGSRDRWRLCQIDLDGRKSFSEVTMTADVEPTPRPSEFSLDQNFPNPFNPSTTIRYGIPARSHVRLIVFNLLGQQVALVQNGEQDEGYHEARFDANGLPSGVYFYRLQAGSYTETKRLLLVR